MLRPWEQAFKNKPSPAGAKEKSAENTNNKIKRNKMRLKHQKILSKQ